MENRTNNEQKSLTVQDLFLTKESEADKPLKVLSKVIRAKELNTFINNKLRIIDVK